MAHYVCPSLTQVFIDNRAMFALLAQLSNLFALVHEVLSATSTDFFFVLDPGENLATLFRKFYQINNELVCNSLCS